MASWQTIQSLLIFFGPLILPRLLSYYRSLRSRPASQIQPLPPKTSYALAVLFLTGSIAFLSTLPVFSPENIFLRTQSRLHTPAGVLLTRLRALREITPFDESLRATFEATGLETRLLYARLGPKVVVNNPLVAGGGPNNSDADLGTLYLLYALPGILAPHLLHIAALGVATSSFLSGREGARWRTQAVIAGLVLGVAELGFIATYDDRGNARSTRVSEIDFVFWKVHVWRGLGIAALDGLLGWVVWLQATGRVQLAPSTPKSERIMENGRIGEKTLGKLRGLGILRNGSLRSPEMRSKVDAYWVKEAEVMRSVFEEPEVLQAQRNALRRMDTERIGREADAFLDNMMAGVPMNS